MEASSWFWLFLLVKSLAARSCGTSSFVSLHVSLWSRYYCCLFFPRLPDTYSSRRVMRKLAKKVGTCLCIFETQCCTSYMLRWQCVQLIHSCKVFKSCFWTLALQLCRVCGARGSTNRKWRRCWSSRQPLKQLHPKALCSSCGPGTLGGNSFLCP